MRIGYATVLKLLRAGAYVLTTTRYPHDAARRYAREPDFDAFAPRLEVVGPLERASRPEKGAAASRGLVPLRALESRREGSSRQGCPPPSREPASGPAKHSTALADPREQSGALCPWSPRAWPVARVPRLADVRLVELFCAAVAARFPRLHLLVNNAAQAEAPRPASSHLRALSPNLLSRVRR